MAHNHDHHGHDHSINMEHVSRAFIVGITLNLLFVIIEVIAGLRIHSLSLLSDAGHNLADVAGLALSLFAMKMLKVKPTDTYTYGYKKTTILVALFNAVILLVSIGAISYEAIFRLINPVPLPGKTVALVAGIGIFINASTALLFFKTKEKDLNIKSAYLHLASDAAVSLGLVAGGIIIFYTHWFWVDSVLGITVAVVILFSTWRLLKDSLRLSLDGVPVDIHMDDIKNSILKMDGVKDFHHIHIWAISTAENALTAHLVLQQGISNEQEQKIRHAVRHELEHHNIKHVTIETERGDEDCEVMECE
ncbi:MAG: cation diffusion facilitator family transporter [Ferruginibacter sp.]